MNYSMIRYILSSVICFEGIFLLLPAATAGIYQEKEGFLYLIIGLACMLIGFWGRRRKPKSSVFYSKEGFAAVALSWIILSLIGALPMYLTGEFPSYIDALFETISGFTTTGSSILSDVETLSRGTAFWRCFIHWIGAGIYYGSHAPFRQLQYASDACRKPGTICWKTGSKGKDYCNDSLWNLCNLYGD